MSPKINTIYSCKILLQSSDLKNLRLLSILLPIKTIYTGLPTKTNRFTLLRSPLGNKKSKDQFEYREYRGVFVIKSDKPKSILLLLDILKNFCVVKSKVIVNFCVSPDSN